MEILKRIVNDIFIAEVDKKSRNRKNVDARKAYSKILKDFGFSFEYIAKTIDKDHSSIVYYCKSADFLFKYDNDFQKRFILAKKQFSLENKNLKSKSNEDIYTIAIELRQELDLMILEKNKLLHRFIEHLERYVKETGYMPDIVYCRKNILPLFSD
jgi:hypothetical protein